MYCIAGYSDWKQNRADWGTLVWKYSTIDNVYNFSLSFLSRYEWLDF